MISTTSVSTDVLNTVNSLPKSSLSVVSVADIQAGKTSPTLPNIWERRFMEVSNFEGSKKIASVSSAKAGLHTNNKGKNRKFI